jgi:carbonic anhydrase
LKLLTRSVLWLCLPIMFLATSPARAADAMRWEYSGERGPEHWGSLRRDYATCDTGRRQSPIDISGAVKEKLPAIEVRYRPATLRMVNNGHTVQIRGDGGNRLLIGQESFRLVQFHFHTPSGDCVEGKCYDMATHFVHKNDAGQLGVLVVLFRQGAENATVQPLWERFPERAGREQSFPDIQFDPARMLPADRGYYSFEGSLTVPPCTEGVRWFVLRQPVELSAAQIARFRALFPINNRPVQPLNGRRVRESL